MRLFICLLMFFSVSAVANERYGEVAYSGEMTPAQIVSSWYQHKAPSKEGLLEVKISTVLVQSGKLLAKDTNGLPGLRNDAGEVVDDAKITIPFMYSLNKSADNQAGFVEFIDNMENMLQKVSLEKTDKAWENLNNCGGFSVGTILNTAYSMSYPFCQRISTTYECMRVNGKNNWYIIDQDIRPIPGCLMIP